MGDVIGKSGYIEKVGKMLEAKSSFLKGVAEGTEGKAGIFKYEILKAIYDEKAIEALENYRCVDPGMGVRCATLTGPLECISSIQNRGLWQRNDRSRMI